MEWLQMIIMAVFQGVAEFLPISSSGHLVVIQHLFRATGNEMKIGTLMLNIFLHFGTLLAVLIVFRRRILLLLSTDRRLIVLLILATIPAVIVGLGIKIYCEETLEHLLLTGCCFIVTGMILLWLSSRSGTKISRELTLRESLGIGLAQAFAVLPGISRSGSTITASLLAGLKRDEAATFSFLLSIPVIGGATLIEMKELYDQMQEAGGSLLNESMIMLLVGVVISCVVGIFSLHWLIRWLEQGKLKYFAYYLFVIGPAVIIWQLITIF